MRTNVKTTRPPVLTHEGAPAYPHMTPVQALRRSVLSCLLWEDEFYEDGTSIATRISALANEVHAADLVALAVEARKDYNLRHVPLLLVKARAARNDVVPRRLIGDTVATVISRADELSEFLSVYWTPKKQKLSKQVKLGLARAFRKFNEYNLAKYDRANKVRLRDVLFLCHAKPKDDEQEALWRRLVNNELAVPDTWEVALSAGADKKATFERLISEGQLGYLALLRNLRNMAQAGCDPALVNAAIVARKGAERVFPFRYAAAARAAPQYEPALDKALCASIAETPPLPGRTVVLVDVSASMSHRLSGKSDMTRMLAAATLASIIPCVRENLRVFSFSSALVEVPPRRGMAGVDAVVNSQGHGSTELANAVRVVNEKVPHDRLIVVTDEQATDGAVPPPVAARAYMINVASNQNGVGYGRWTHLDGFSESIIRYIAAVESEANLKAMG